MTNEKLLALIGATFNSSPGVQNAAAGGADE